jgi:hypothetical protein
MGVSALMVVTRWDSVVCCFCNFITLRAALHNPRSGMAARRDPGFHDCVVARKQGRGQQRMRTYKIVVFVPEADGERLRVAMGEAGAGRIGNYAHCSFTVRGIGRFQPLAGANPAVGQIGGAEEVVEERIEMLCADDRLRDGLAAIRPAHPYEEPAIDVYPLAEIE